MSRPDYPSAPPDDIVDELFGRPVPDPYRWLEDPADPRTQAWSAAQDAICRRRLDGLPGRRAFRTRLRALLGAGAVTAPVWRGDRSFFLRRTAEQEHAVLLVREPDGTERVLVDPVGLDPAGTTTLDAWQPDKEGRRLAYQVSSGGDEESLIHVLDVVTGEEVEQPIDRARYSPIAWLPGGEAYYYVRRLAPDVVSAGEEQFHRRVLLHRLGTDPAADVEVFGADRDKTTYYGMSVSRDGRWLTVSATLGTAPRTDVWIADLAVGAPERPDLREVMVGRDAQASLHVGRDGRLYVQTDLDAPRGRLCVADPADPAPERWRDLVPEDPEAVLDDFAILDGGDADVGDVDGGEMDGEVGELLVSRTRHAVSELARHDLASGRLLGTVDLPGLGVTGGLSERPEGGSEAWFGYGDFASPGRVERYDARTGQVTTYAEPPGQVDVPPVAVRQVDYPGRDGTTVRMFLICGDRGPSGPRPTILYGYGGFGVPLTPGYSAAILSWVAAGGVYAVANLRGGSEEGEAWHRAGMREHKQNVFDDFIAAGEWLVDQRWTTPSQLAISGGSNGGLLVGAALSQRPELFAGAVCSAPLLDMVRYERFGLGETWNDEYGTAADAAELAWLLAYSPYHRVVARLGEEVDYPAVLFTVFDADSRVDPLHARKMCAALQAGTSGRPVLIRREADVGHGARSISRSIELSVDTAVFLAAATGLDPD